MIKPSTRSLEMTRKAESTQKGNRLKKGETIAEADNTRMFETLDEGIRTRLRHKPGWQVLACMIHV